ncbi:MAG: hypothetical protein WKG07_02205 [Hymenobacter sp.]
MTGFHLNQHGHEVQNREILISLATPATVWRRVLTDFASYPAPGRGVHRSVSGRVAVGQQLGVDFRTRKQPRSWPSR